MATKPLAIDGPSRRNRVMNCTRGATNRTIRVRIAKSGQDTLFAKRTQFRPGGSGENVFDETKPICLAVAWSQPAYSLHDGNWVPDMDVRNPLCLLGKFSGRACD